MFGMTEQVSQTARRSEGDAKLALVRGLLDRRGLDAVVLGTADHVAWATGGITNPIERGASASPLWLLVRHDGATDVTTNVERDAMDAEAGLEELGIPLVEVPWYDAGALEHAAADLADAPREQVGGLGADVDDDLVELRLALLPSERERLAALAIDATTALEEALREWTPGALDLDVQARISERLHPARAVGPCLIVGGDDRVERFRHPLAAGVPMERLVMAVVVAERGGLHAAATRFASAGPLTINVQAARNAALAVEAATLDACVAGARYGDVLAALDRGYAEAGHPGAWAEHYQGGP